MSTAKAERSRFHDQAKKYSAYQKTQLVVATLKDTLDSMDAAEDEHGSHEYV